MTHRILVADDDTVSRRLVSYILEREGFEVVMVASGAEALDALAEQPVSVVVTDRNMPGVDGPNLIKAMRESTWAMDVPVIMITSSSSLDDEVQAASYGVTAFLTKPVASRELVHAVRTVLARK